MRPHHLFGTRATGDFAGTFDPAAPWPVPPDVPLQPWTWLTQVHGARVVTVTTPGEHAGAEADAAVTAEPGCALLIRTADCAPVWFDGGDVVGVAHAGWKGLVAGVVQSTIEAMRALGAGEITGIVGPTIRPGCYEFGADALAPIVDRYGPAVQGTTEDGRSALHLPVGVILAAEEVGVALDSMVDCPACEPSRYFSHRARQETGRQGTFAWLEP